MSAALVLSGGGANGAYEVGVMKALFEGRSPATLHRKLEPSAIAATSIGAFNASVLLSKYDGQWDAAAAALGSIWLERMATAGGTSPNGVFRFRPNVLEWFDIAQLRAHPLRPMQDLAGDAAFFARDWMARMSGFMMGSSGLAHRVAELFDLSTLLTPEPSAELVRDVVSCERLRAAACALRVTTTQWETGTLRVFANHDFTDDIGGSIVRASGAIPGLFPPVPIDGEPHVDGGLVLNTPLKPAIDAGASVLHVVYLDPAPGAIPLPPVSSTVDAMGRTFVASFAATMRRDLDVAARVNRAIAAGHSKGNRSLAIHLYHPLEDAGGALGMLDFHRDRVEHLIDLGYRNASAHDCTRAGCVKAGGH
jgi:NTE family protein